MNIVSWNVRRLGRPLKRVYVRDFLRSHKAVIVLLQETKLNTISDAVGREIWGATSADNWICREAAGSSGGDLSPLE